MFLVKVVGTNGIIDVHLHILSQRVVSVLGCTLVLCSLSPSPFLLFEAGTGGVFFSGKRSNKPTIWLATLSGEHACG